MKVAVTGATGYIGGRVVAALRRLGHVPVALSRHAPRDASIGHIPFDLAGDTLPVVALRNVDAIVHCAWDFSGRGLTSSRRVNVAGAERLLTVAKEAGICRLVAISTMSAFPGCRSLYGQTKCEVEKLFLAAGGLVIRPGLVWGDQPGGMMGTLDRLARLPISPVIAGGGRLYLIHADDLASLVASALESSVWSGGRTITVAHPRSFGLGDILAVRARQAGRRCIPVPVPWPLVWLGVRLVETILPRSGFRSDSVIGLVHACPTPRFDSPLETPGMPHLREFGL